MPVTTEAPPAPPGQPRRPGYPAARLPASRRQHVFRIQAERHDEVGQVHRLGIAVGNHRSLRHRPLVEVLDDRHATVRKRQLQVVPDLRASNFLGNDFFYEIVLNGAMKDAGMAPFKAVLDQKDATAIRAYLIKRANEDKVSGVK